MRNLVLICGLSMSFTLLSALAEEGKESLPSIETFTENMERYDGLFTLFWDSQAGKIWLEVEELPREFIYVEFLRTGLGSNPVGLDRGQPSRSRLVRIEKVGLSVYLIEENLRYRAISPNRREVEAVDESFPDAVLWGGVAQARTDERLLVDFTSFAVRDSHQIALTLEATGQGSYRLLPDRSFVYLPGTKAFEKNVELEAVLTFGAEQSGALVHQTAADPQAVTLRVHQSFVDLPDSDYAARPFDPRMASMLHSYADYAAPLDESLVQRVIERHRLKKKNPDAAVSEPVEPIVYYVDPGAPEPIRTALKEGAAWWNEAFEAAGFRDAFRVEILPEEADPLDVRYNVIQWVHRSTRGWSYGSSITDPRTGEIIKGHVSLGSLRIRQDQLIIEGLQANKYSNGSCGMGIHPGAGILVQLDPDSNPTEVALARIRQLSAHEVGHTLGFSHNFAASTFGRASVMDYPAPLVKVVDGELDFSDAYDEGIGEWDKVAVRYAYTEFDSEDAEAQGLQQIISESLASGMFFLTDADARPAGAAHPFANLWDNGAEPAVELERVLEVRRIALDRLGERSLDEASPVAELKRTLVPIYLYHRYQIDAAAKLLGGVDYRYAVKGDGQVGQKMIDGQQQERALNILLRAISPAELTVPEPLLKALIPDPPGYSDPTRELFPGRTSIVFDRRAAAEVAADLVLAAILQPERAARMNDFSSRDPGLPSFAFVVDKLLKHTWFAAPPTDRSQLALAQTVQGAVLRHLVGLAEDPKVDFSVRAAAEAGLRELRDGLESQVRDSRAGDSSFTQWGLAEVERFLNRAYRPEERPKSMNPPPGSPIG